MVKKLLAITAVFLFIALISACADNREKTLRWKNLEKELHKLAVEAINEHKDNNENIVVKTIPNTDIRCGFLIPTYEDETSIAMSFGFPLQDKKIVDNLVRALARMYGEPTITRYDLPSQGDLLNPFSELLSWKDCSAWYYEIEVDEFSWVTGDNSHFIVRLKLQNTNL